MTGVTTATVETLTAEVRVLMVGNRQVTLSVAKQLDTVGICELAPFGRIRMDGGWLYAIGRDRVNGDLVKADLYHGGDSFATRSPSHYACSFHDQDEPPRVLGGPRTDDAEGRREWDAASRAHVAWQDAVDREFAARLRAARALPLIVLAGLR